MKKNIYPILAFICILLFACNDSKENSKLLIGQWVMSTSDNIISLIGFNEDNTMSGSLLINDPTIPGKYVWSGGKSIVMSWSGIRLGIIDKQSGLDIPVDIKVEVISLTKDSLIMTLQGDKFAYHRINR